MGIYYYSCESCGRTFSDCDALCACCNATYCEMCAKEDGLLRYDDKDSDDDDDDNNVPVAVECAACSADASFRKIVKDVDLINWILNIHDYGNRKELEKQFIAANCVQPPPESPVKRPKETAE